MKRVYSLFLAVVVCAAVSCSGGNGPKVVAEKFCKAIYSGDFDQAEELCTQESRIPMGAVKEYAGDKIEKMKTAKINYEFGEAVLSDDGRRATVQVFITGAISLVDGSVEGRKSKEIHLLKNDDGCWQINLKSK